MCYIYIYSITFFLFTTELLAELVGQALAEGLFEGIGGIFKGTGEILGDALAHIDF
ncbi:hypothetical protein ACSX1A_19105 [Pontibacter sp. MBLB2868]|uniref:hypothetical protein n=1 Tax=Pontibacter sp. MBLB2868 TaxID=3451555 RepID=UPI003F74C3F8